MFLIAGSVIGFLSVAMGAFGAHALKGTFDEYSLGVYKTAVEYQFWHALALLVVGVLERTSSSESLKISGWSFILGVIIFSGSLYVLSFTKVKLWGAVTPFGGVAFMIGWIFLAYHAWKN